MKKSTRIKSDYAALKSKKKQNLVIKNYSNLGHKENELLVPSKLNTTNIRSPYLENISNNISHKKRPKTVKKKKFIIK